MKSKSSKSGFTLIEILVVAVLIAVLGAAGFASYSSANIKARDAKRKSDLEQIRAALEMYRADYGWYSPDKNSLSTGGYLPVFPGDPKSTCTYSYAPTDASGGHAYGYEVQTALENLGSVTSTCAVVGNLCGSCTCNYCLKNP